MYYQVMLDLRGQGGGGSSPEGGPTLVAKWGSSDAEGAGGNHMTTTMAMIRTQLKKGRLR